MDAEDGFDPTLLKKKKKKKTTFDLDSALGLDDGTKKVSDDVSDETAGADAPLNELELDLDSFGKKKKKEEETFQPR